MDGANHPRSCRGCDGTGYQPGAPFTMMANGVNTTYSTVVPCTHHWTDDDPHEEHITLEQYLERVVARQDWPELERWQRFLGRT